jgi:hypothetical protein
MLSSKAKWFERPAKTLRRRFSLRPPMRRWRSRSARTPSVGFRPIRNSPTALSRQYCVAGRWAGTTCGCWPVFEGRAPTRAPLRARRACLSGENSEVPRKGQSARSQPSCAGPRSTRSNVAPGRSPTVRSSIAPRVRPNDGVLPLAHIEIHLDRSR